MSQREIGLERGRRAGADAKAGGDWAGRTNAAPLQEEMKRESEQARILFPSLGDMDLAAAVRDYDRERLACEPDYAKFPEMRGLLERHVGEREGFREASGLDEAATAFHFSWQWFLYRRINARHVPYWQRLRPPAQCTNVFFPEGKEGVTISDNRDIEVRGATQIPQWRQSRLRRDNLVSWMQGAASSAVVMDEEPVCCFPCSPIELLPDECFDDIQALIEFMTRYREFWGPGNQIWVDRKLNAVAVEKTNCRVAFRYPTVAGAVCITACSYLDPDLHAFKQQCLRKVMAGKGEPEEDSADWHFDAGAHLRNERLLALTNAEAGRPGGATLWGAFNIVADEAVPFPARICLSGQKTFADHPEREGTASWSVTQHAGVITGPRRRWLYRSIQDIVHPRSVTSWKPKLLLGEGVEMQPEWQVDIDNGLCELAPPAESEG